MPLGRDQEVRLEERVWIEGARGQLSPGGDSGIVELADRNDVRRQPVAQVVLPQRHGLIT